MKPIPPIDQCDVFWHVPCRGIQSDNVKVGTFARNEGNLYFAYDAEWIPLGIEISPGYLPLENGVVPISLTDPRSPAYVEDLGLRNEFRGMPGPFYDSLPDKWGMKLIEKFTGSLSDDLDPLEILCHRGNRCMGAFSYRPASTHKTTSGPISSDELDLYCTQAAMLASGIEDDLESSIMDALDDSGGSAGGMRPKMLLAIHKSLSSENPASAPAMRRLAGFDYHDMPADFQPWLLKFDTKPDEFRGLIEEACANMARLAGVTMPETKLIRTKTPNGKLHSHFAVLRFDRQLVGTQWHRVHMHTAAGMLQRDYNALDLDYTDLLALTNILTNDPEQVRQVFTRAVFNVFSGNSDDHAKNHAFLLDASGDWKISPAYDLTPSRLRMQPDMRSTSVLQIKSEKIPLSILRELANEHGITDPDPIILQVSAAVKKWKDCAKAVGVPKQLCERYDMRMQDIHPAELKKKTPNKAVKATPEKQI